MDGFRFILENPHPNASNNKQRKRARLVTACDSCRVKKIKCQQSSPNARCEACKTAKTPCLFGDRDRYQAERGVSCTWNPPPVEESPVSPASPKGTSRKRKMASPSYSASPPNHWTPPSSVQSSRSATPADGLVPTDRYFHPESHANTSTLHGEFDAFHATSLPSSRDVSYDTLPLFDPSRPRYPHPQRMRHLGAIFFDKIGSHFPFLDRYDVLHRIEQRTCSAVLSNCIAGLAARFADSDSLDATASATFYDMAKSLAAQVVCVPSVEALHALICITWAEYGAGRDSGYWMYSRMAIAMCLDLGLGNEATIQVAATPEVRLRLRMTWWMVVCMADISIAWATGQPATLDLDAFDTALPPTTDDVSLMFRNNIELCLLLRGRLNRLDNTNTEKQNDCISQWDPSDLRPCPPVKVDMSFRSPESYDSGLEGEIFTIPNFFDDSPPMPFSLDSPPDLLADVFLSKDITGLNKFTSPTGLYSPLPWLTRA